jgi:hypothetical protein
MARNASNHGFLRLINGAEHAENLSFRRISALIGLHWTRVAQILKGK